MKRPGLFWNGFSSSNCIRDHDGDGGGGGGGNGGDGGGDNSA